MSQPALPTRPVGRSSLRVSVLGLGCATLGGSRFPVSPQVAAGAIHQAWNDGVRYVDTAPFYGYGAAERRVGDALRAMPRGDWVLSTKVGRLLVPCANPPAGAGGTPRPMPFDAVYDYSYDGVMRSFEASLQRLGLDRIDMLFVHDIGAYVHGAAHAGHMQALERGGYRALDSLRSGGAVRAIGLGVFETAVCLEAMQWGHWDAFLLAGGYTLLGQEPLMDLLPACETQGVSLIVGSPLNSGILAGGGLWNYKAPPPPVAARAEGIRDVCAAFGVPVVAAALQFVLAHPAVAAVLPGPRSAQEQADNLRALHHPIPPGLWAALRDRHLLHPQAPVPQGPVVSTDSIERTMHEVQS
ncbi:aldo/keto reductase [Variovorax terrae]|uniref:Aldo/keto reductase n=1 Tax=Variovorax terrae TaxID=2923278 RepID=A0A9X1VTD3_9BURK|nr:aldo/keto reductase [Variovorax terrae]MCJ0762958.1 aldo/keto reductase [Variovorax terrae]